ncbi:Pimeloyl-ACP methyl ester carboxylesterase [Sinosporangium album]|uniref:Pimeloyl-ACP methyl ester carboxylesterase n=1 Tax=Sinosporangium album TaxID=504805 RepID=A0A1G8IQY2_9ACTN|nr:alpha/beta fold hydrolase [Sinosporangium album]SDI21273.1 Pimeloyl-ACP methyl ester carboxylesterase [Sinosporangium album]
MTDPRTLTRVAAWLLVAAALLYSLWLPQQYLNPHIDRVTAYISELDAADQPWSWIGRLGDALAGAAVLAAVALVPDPRPNRWSLTGWIGLAVFGAATLIDGMLALDCATLSDPACLAREHAGTVSLSHDLHTASSAVAAFGAMFSLLTLPVGSRSRAIRYGGAVLAPAALAATVWTLLAVSLQGQVGAAQRLQVALFALWTVVVAYGLPRAGPAGRRGGVHVVREGTGTPVIVLASGIAGAWFHWDGVAAALRGEGTVVGFDRPGLGRSPAPVVPPTLRREAVRLLALAGGSPAVLVAHSAAAWHAEACARWWPGPVVGMVLVDPSCEPGGRRGTAFGRALRGAMPALGGTFGMAVLARLLGPPAHRLLAPDGPGDGREREVYGSARVAAASAGEWLAYRDMAHDMAALRRERPYPPIPTVVIGTGADDRCQRDLAASLRAELVVLPGCGHQVHLERPAAVAAAVRAVIAAWKRGGRRSGPRSDPH